MTVFRNNKLWVEIHPLAKQDDFSALPHDTKVATDETEAMLSDPDHTTYRTAKSLFASLGI